MKKWCSLKIKYLCVRVECRTIVVLSIHGRSFIPGNKLLSVWTSFLLLHHNIQLINAITTLVGGDIYCDIFWEQSDELFSGNIQDRKKKLSIFSNIRDSKTNSKLIALLLTEIVASGNYSQLKPAKKEELKKFYHWVKKN